MSAFRALIARDVRLSTRVGGGALTGTLFFLAVIVTIPFGVGPDLNLLSRIGPAIMWIAALLATLIGLERLFQSDKDDGALDLLRLTDSPVSTFVIAKVIAHWLGSSLPLVLVTPLLSLLLALEPRAILALTATSGCRHARAVLPGSGGRGACCDLASRRAFDGGHHSTLFHPGTYLRCRCHPCRHR
jgi:heme exporter protein B